MQGETNTDKVAYSVSEVAAMLGVSVRLMWEEVKLRRISHTKIGAKRVVITQEQLKHYLDSNSHS